MNKHCVVPTPVLLPGKSHGQRSLVGCSPWGCRESDMTERLHFDFLLSCIGEGNGNPLQCSCLENPRDGGALWADVYGVAQSRTRLKRLSSNSSSVPQPWKWVYNSSAVIFQFYLKFTKSAPSWSLYIWWGRLSRSKSGRAGEDETHYSRFKWGNKKPFNSPLLPPKMIWHFIPSSHGQRDS